jgi:hypothetical protein
MINEWIGYVPIFFNIAKFSFTYDLNQIELEIER